MGDAISSRYGRPVPRYTSYPTAAQFNVAVGSGEHADWLRALDGKSASLYFHVPFCEELCWYCACNTMAMNRPDTLEAYTSALEAELTRVASVVPNLMVDGIQWGGGTPGHLGNANLRRLGARIDALFDRRSDGEVSFEIDPRHCNEELVETLAAIGVARASFGIQDFNDVVQRAINRRQSVEATQAAISRLRSAGIRRFNLDLVYGLPQQTVETLDRTLSLALALAPDRFAVFGYAHVPWMKAHQKLIDSASLPDATVRVRMAELAARRLTDAGYVHIGLDHYARPDDRLAVAAQEKRLRRTFQGYVADSSPWVIGIGASAISSLPGGFTQNTAAASRYLVQAASTFTTARGIALNDEDRLRGNIIAELMCRNRVDISAACRKFGVDDESFVASIDRLPELHDDGLIGWEDGELALTERGRPLARFVCAAFDRHFTGGEGRHSSGV